MLAKARKTAARPTAIREYFNKDLFKKSTEAMDRELATFFAIMFGIDVDNDDLLKANFPTFEEVLGLTDLAIMRKEAFRDFDIENRASNSGKLRFIAQYIVFLVAKVIDATLQEKSIIHRKLVGKLNDAKILKNITFVSTNYDIIIDNALIELYD